MAAAKKKDSDIGLSVIVELITQRMDMLDENIKGQNKILSKQGENINQFKLEISKINNTLQNQKSTSKTQKNDTARQILILVCGAFFIGLMPPIFEFIYKAFSK